MTIHLVGGRLDGEAFVLDDDWPAIAFDILEDAEYKGWSAVGPPYFAAILRFAEELPASDLHYYVATDRVDDAGRVLYRSVPFDGFVEHIGRSLAS